MFDRAKNRNKATDGGDSVGGGVTTLGKKYSKLVRMVGRRCCKVGRRRRVQDAEGE